jgi:D-alanyl-D-alanine carboxypeptidase
MTSKLNESFFQETTQKMLKNKSVFGAVLCVEKGDASISWVGGVGNIKAEDRYFIASVTKLYVTAVMLMLRVKNSLTFSDKIYKYFPEELISGIGELK